jgi:hypothetical protein
MSISIKTAQTVVAALACREALFLLTLLTSWLDVLLNGALGNWQEACTDDEADR